MNLRSWIPAFAGMTIVSVCWSIEPLFPAKPTGYVTDQARVLKDGSRLELEAYLADFERRTSVQVAVVTLPTLGGNDIAAVAVDLFKKWGIGEKGKDNGVLFLIVPADRRMRIEVGYGLEGALPDALTGRIMDEAVIPKFRAGDINGGILDGTKLLCKVIEGKADIAPASVALRGQPWVAVLVLLVLAIIFIRDPWLIFFILASRGRGGHGGGGGFGGGGFGGFGGGSSGGGGASRGW